MVIVVVGVLVMRVETHVSQSTLHVLRSISVKPVPKIKQCGFLFGEQSMGSSSAPLQLGTVVVVVVVVVVVSVVVVVVVVVVVGVVVVVVVVVVVIVVVIVVVVVVVVVLVVVLVPVVVVVVVVHVSHKIVQTSLKWEDIPTANKLS